MKPGDYAPPAFPSLEQQQDALQKGLGRAVHWAMSGQLDDRPLLEACLRDQRYDSQCEESRGDWLWQLIRTVGATARLRVPILHALYGMTDERSATQLCELARCYAQTGDDPFRTLLYDIVERKPFETSPWIGEEELVALEGERGFLHAAQVRGRLLNSREWEWDDQNLIDFASELLGAEQVACLLDASPDDAIRRFRECWRNNQPVQSEDQRQSYRDRLAAVPVAEAIQAAEGGTNCYWLRGWGRFATEADLHLILQHLWTVQEPKVIANLLKVFAARAVPTFDPRLIAYCQHADEEVQRRAYAALRQIAHPLLREFGLTQLQEGDVQDGAVIALFIKNYQPGDEHRIVEGIELPNDDDELHWLLMQGIDVLKENPAAECAQLGIITYVLTPCTNCRCHAAQLLLNQHAAPEWLIHECQHDVAADIRALVSTPSKVLEES